MRSRCKRGWDKIDSDLRPTVQALYGRSYSLHVPGWNCTAVNWFDSNKAANRT